MHQEHSQNVFLVITLIMYVRKRYTLENNFTLLNRIEPQPITMFAGVLIYLLLLVEVIITIGTSAGRIFSGIMLP